MRCGQAILSVNTASSLAGFVPLFQSLLPLRLKGRTNLLLSTIATKVTFFLIGVAKGRVLERSLLRSGLETLAVGGAAAPLAYGRRAALHMLLGQ